MQRPRCSAKLPKMCGCTSPITRLVSMRMCAAGACAAIQGLDSQQNSAAQRTFLDDIVNLRSGLIEQQRSEFLQVAAPGLPLVRRARRFIVYGLDARPIEPLVKGLDGGGHPLGFRGAYADPHQLHLLIEGRSIAENAVVGGLRVKRRSAAHAAAGSAESADIRDRKSTRLN